MTEVKVETLRGGSILAKRHGLVDGAVILDMSKAKTPPNRTPDQVYAMSQQTVEKLIAALNAVTYKEKK